MSAFDLQNAKFLLAIIQARNEPALIIICVMFYTKKDKRRISLKSDEKPTRKETIKNQ